MRDVMATEFCLPTKPSEEAQRQQFFNNLLNALRPSSYGKAYTSGTFAACEAIKPSQGFSLKSFHVAGVGELQLPLSAGDMSQLRKVHCGTSSNTEDRHSLQVDASKVTFPGEPTFLSNTIQALAMQAVSAMGLDGELVQLEAHLDKLVVLEVGDKFVTGRDPEKGKEVFGSLVLQLPTEEHTSGKLVVQYKWEEYISGKFLVRYKGRNPGRKQQFESPVSATGFCYTVYFASCHHVVRKIESETGVCLAFDLVRCDPSFDSVDKWFTPDKLTKVEAAFEPWLEERRTGRQDLFGRILYIPLQHRYEEKGLSFPGLKPEDRIAAELLKECKDQSGKQWLDIHLCLATIRKPGAVIAKPRSDSGRGEYLGAFETKCWIGSDGTKRHFKDLCVDMKKEFVVGEEEDPFDSEPDKESICSSTHTWAMLVAWPRIHSFPRACDASVSWALDILENLYETGDSNFCVQLHRLISHCCGNPFKVWGAQTDSRKDDVTPRLLNFCTRAKVSEKVPPILDLLSYGDCKVGVRNAKVAKAISDTVQVFGWELVSLPIVKLAKECGSFQSESFTLLAENLKCMGLTDAGALVANTTSQALKARIVELESHQMPHFTWCQPFAKFPEDLVIEKFLKGPLKKYVHRDFRSLPDARLFCTKYFNDQKWKSSVGYSAVGTPGGRGCGAYCEIQKTRRLFDFSLDQWHKEQKLIEHLRLVLGKLRSAGSDTITVPGPVIGH